MKELPSILPIKFPRQVTYGFINFPVDYEVPGMDESYEREMSFSNWKIHPGYKATQYDPPEPPEVEVFEARWNDSGKKLTSDEWDKYVEPNIEIIEDRILEYADEMGSHKKW